MSLSIRPVLFVIISCFTSVFLSAQTLYWVGGPGNFNDPSHWSLTSGGSPANVIPDFNTDVVFDDYSANRPFVVNITGEAHVRSFQNSFFFKAVKFIGNNASKLNVAGSFLISKRVLFEPAISITFESASQAINEIDFGVQILNNNLTFKSGNYNFISLQVTQNRTINFGNGKYHFNSVFVSAGSIINEDDQAQFFMQQSYFKATNKFKIAPGASVQSDELYVIADIYTPQNYSVPPSLANSKGYNPSSVNALCPVTISLSPACSGPCTGVLTVSLSAACLTPPYSVNVTNGTCPANAAALSNTNIPAVYTVTNACACAANYIIVVRDGSNQIQAATNTANFSPNSAIIFDNNVSPQCSYSCDGTLEGVIIGTAPFSVTVVPSTTATIPAFTTAVGDYSITGMCAGTYTFNIRDAGGCFTSLVSILTAPATLSANPVTTSITCNGANTGAFAITPAGGTANYTVNFSNSTTQTSSGGAVSATGLGPGPVSATLTDSQSCTLTASGNVVQPSGSLTAVSSQTNLSCNSICIGAASSTVSGGTTPYSYTWSPVAGSSSVITGLCAGTQTLNIRDANGCATTIQTFTITQPPAITLTPSSTNVVCSGSCTGVASVTPSGGTGAFTFTWIAPGPVTMPGNSSSQSNLCAGSYTAIVRDANLCSSQIVITISQPPTVTLTTSSQSVTCFGLSDGVAGVSPAGGNGAPYTFSWSPGGQTTATISGLPANNYTVVVRDAQLCPTQTIIAINQPALDVTPAVTHANLTCNVINAPCNGSINATPIGGTAPYQYTLATSGSTIMTDPPYNNLCTGTYTVMVKDLSGCPQQSVVTLTSPAAIIPTITITTPISCFGTSVAVLTGTPGNGGTPGYTLNWATPSGAATGGTLTNRPAGNYTLFVTDSNGCPAQTTATVTQPTSMTVAATSTNISCFSVCNGVLTSTVVGGGTPGYAFAWTNSLNVNVGNASTASGLCPGGYTLTVTDNLSCTRTVAATVSSPPPIVLGQTTTPVNCFGDSNGSATVSASGGTPSYTFSFNSTPPVVNTTGVLNGQPAGNFTATVNDAAGCVQTITFAITTPTALATALNFSNSCNVCGGAATITPSFGTPIYAIQWTSGLGGNFANTSVVTNLCTDNYTATVTDSKGCVSSKTVAIQQVISITINSVVASILCNGAATGSANTIVGGGVAPYTYSWTSTPTPQTGPSLSGVVAGTYTVRVTDSTAPTACSHTAAITISEPPAMVITSTQTNVTCFSFSTGAISTTVTGGTIPISYTWSPGGQNTSGISNLAAGIYTLNFRDNNLCPQTQTYTITQSPSITITFTSTNPSACATPNGSICTTASGGSGSGYTYLWSPGSATTTCISGLNGGTYQQTVTDGAGCTNSISVTLFNASGPALTAVSRSVSCFGDNTGSATVTATGTGPFTFTWSPAVTSVVNSPSTTATGLISGTYVVNCTDFNGCVTNTTIVIAQPPAITINSVVTNARCNALCSGSITVAPTGGTPGSPSYTFSWLPAAPPITGQGTATITNLCANPYTLNLRDGNNCIYPFVFNISQPPAFTVTAVTSSVLCNGVCSGSITTNASGGTGVINYSWTPVGGNSPTITNLCANGGTNPPSYTLTVTDAQSCTLATTYTIVQPSALSSTVTVQLSSCSNSCNAVATNTASGGTPTYTYSWSSSPVTTNTLGALCPGTYSATVTDGNNCTFTRQYTVNPRAPLTVTLNPTNPLCNAACNGSITTLVSGAQGTVNYSWSPAGTGQNPTGLCAVPNPNYTLVATDQSSCQVTAVVTLTNPPLLLASVSATNPLCNNNSNGMATVSFTNAIGTPQFTWIPTGPPVQTAQTATGLASGPYTVIVRDNNQCQTTQTFTLSNPTSITISSVLAQPSCSLANGGITVTPSGGTPGFVNPYTYTWTGVVSSSSVVSNLFAGIYAVQVADSVGCVSNNTITLNNANGPTGAPVSSSSIICNALCTGAASIDVSGITGGTPSYDVFWQAPISFSGAAVSNLCAGSYSAQITDAAGCIFFTVVTIAEPPPVVTSPSILFPLCPGICDGTIAINASGGNSPYTYTWAPVSSNSPTVGNLCAGDYSVIIGYNGVCSDTAYVNLPVQSSITIVPTVTNNTCFGDCNAIASISVSGGASPYNASWSNSQTGFVTTGLCNGSYTVSVTDNNGCNNTATASIVSNAQITATTSIVQPSCGACNGTALVNASGGVSPFSFNWSTSATTQAVSNMCAGLYQVIITDAASCSQTQTVIINNSNGITGENFNVQEIPCSNSCTGAATVTAIGGTAPIAYNWINTSPVSTNTVVNNMCPGTYFVQMTDAVGCVRISSITLNPVITLSVSPFIQLPLCGFSNGSINIVVAGGTPGYTFVWNPPAGNTTSLTGLNTGVYSFTVTESSPSACSFSQTINMSNADGPVLSTTQKNMDCFNVCTGSLSANSTSTATPLSYNWSNSANTQAITNLCKGVITLTVTDINSCKTIRSFTITDNPQLQLGFANVHNSTCFGDCEGTITLIPNGGVFPYTYLWSPSGLTANPAIGLCDGVHSATVTDSKGCSVLSTPITLASASSMSIVSNETDASCSSVADATITLVITGGTPEYQFTWQGPSGFSTTVKNLENVYAGTYSLVVSDDLGCSKDTVLQIIPTITVIAQGGNDPTICPETGTMSIDASASSGSASYKWFTLADSVNAIATTPSFTVGNMTQPATYVLVATSSVASCFDRDTVTVNLFDVEPADAGQDFLVPVYSTVTIGGNPTSSSAVSLTWSPGGYLNDANSFNPIASNTVSIMYTVTITDNNGCISKDSVQVALYPELKITSGFSPNGDGKNDEWIIDYIDQFPNTSVEIYNRWGDRIFVSDGGYRVPFDGKYKGKELPVGTYYYIINLNHPGYTKPITGPLTIFR